MKTVYEGMFILPKKLGDDDLESALNSIREDIEKSGGEVQTTTRLGKRLFARPMKKQDSGHYYVIDFQLEGTQVDSLLARLKLNDNSFRVQIVRKVEDESVSQAASVEE